MGLLPQMPTAAPPATFTECQQLGEQDFAALDQHPVTLHIEAAPFSQSSSCCLKDEGFFFSQSRAWFRRTLGNSFKLCPRHHPACSADPGGPGRGLAWASREKLRRPTHILGRVSGPREGTSLSALQSWLPPGSFSF